MLLLIFSTLFVSALAQKLTIADFLKAEKICLAKSPPEVKDVLHNLKISRVLPDNPSMDFKCFFACMGDEMGLIDADGNFHAEKLKDFTKDALEDGGVTPEEVHAAVEECTKVEHDVLCEKVHLYLDCKHNKFKHVDVKDELKQSTAE